MNWKQCWQRFWIATGGQRRKGRYVRARYRLPRLERLEDRITPSQDTLATALPLSFAVSPVAQVSGTLTTANQVNLCSVQLSAGDQLTASIDAQRQGSSLQAALRLFDSSGVALSATASSTGSDPQLTYSVTVSGTYYVGVSSLGDATYNPTTSGSGSGGNSTGLYALSVNDLLARFVNATPLNSGNQVLQGALTGGQPQDYSVTVTSGTTGDTVLIATAVPQSSPGFEPRVALYDGTGELLIQSDQQQPLLASATVEQHLQAGTYYLEVSAPASTLASASYQAYQLTTTLAASLPPFAPLPVGRTPDAVAVADLGNGYPDIVTTNLDDSTVSVLQGNGDGTFQPAQSFPVGFAPDAVAVADLGNGRSDIVIANQYTGMVSVLLGNGDGTFQQAQSYPVGIEPISVAVADVNGDGHPDIVTANAYDNTVSVLLGNGDGTFQPAQSFPVGYGPFSVAVADLNGDGHPDIVTANYLYNTVSVLLGNGDGTFQPALSFAVGSQPESVAVADLGNGQPDIITANAGDSTVSVLLGNGDGTFQPDQTFLVGNHPESVAVADLGNGQPDLVTANAGDSTISVLLGNGDGTFQSALSFAVGALPNSVVVADLGNGHPDIVTANDDAYTVSVLLGNGDGTFQSAQSVAVGSSPESAAAADLGNGHPDIVTANYDANSVSVLLGNGDNTFQPARSLTVGSFPDSVAVANLGNGHPDIVTANSGDNTVSVLLNNGDGTFQPAQSFAVGNLPYAIAVADLGNGQADIVTANLNTSTVSVLLGNGDGTFQPAQSYLVGSGPDSVAVADLGNGHPDIVTANFGDGTLSVLLGNGDGTFQPAQSIPVGIFPFSVVAADLGNGHPDLVTALAGASTVSVMLGNGDGTFQPAQFFSVGSAPEGVAVADLGNGRPDIVTANAGDNTVSVLLNNGDGTFQPAQSIPVGSFPFSVVAADLGNGYPDIVTTNKNANTVSVLLNNGDGTFQPAQSLPVGFGPYSMAAADLGNGKSDIVTADYGANAVSVSLGNGNGSFQSAQSPLAVGRGPDAVALADVIGDGRPDIVTANEVDNTVSVLLGNGDGTFTTDSFSSPGLPPGTFAVGNDPVSVAVADLGNGHMDIITANAADNTVSVLLGNGDGTFQPALSFAVGSDPVSVAVADLGNGHPDIITADNGSNTVSVLLGNGDGAFQPALSFAVGSDPESVAVADLGNGHPDIVTADYGAGAVSVLLGNGPPGTDIVSFQAAQSIAVGSLPHSVVVANLGNGHPDIVTANYEDSTVSVLLGNGNGTFHPAESFAVGSLPESVVVADVNDDGRPDIITANAGVTGTTTVLLNLGQEQFQSPTATSGISSQDVPQLQDFTGNGILDAVSLDQNTGQILFRKGTGDPSNPFAPFVVVNPGRPAVDFTLVQTPGLPEIAVLDAVNQQVILYAWSSSTRTFQEIGSFATGPDPVRIASGELDGNGLGDIVVANDLDNTLTIALQQSPGSFATFTRNVGAGPSSISFGDLNGDRLLDIVVSDQVSGDVTVLFNDASHSFTNQERSRAGLDPFDVNIGPTSTTLVTQLQTVGVVTGQFTGGSTDVVALNANTDSFSLLLAAGGGSLIDPQVADSYLVGQGAVQVLVGDFLHNGRQDLAVLTTQQTTQQDSSQPTQPGASQVLVFLNNGNGTFRAPISSAAGEGAAGFSFVAGTDSQPNRLLIGDAYGDVLTLDGDGGGHFSVDRGDLNSVPLAVGTTSAGQQFVVVADQNLDQVLVYFLIPGTNRFAAPVPITTNGPTLLAPGAVQLLDLANDGIPDLVVADTLGNDILVYPGEPDGTFGTPSSFAVGDEPVSFTAGYLKGNNVLDLAVANAGSNDISILDGSIDPTTGQWTASDGPRLQSGGSEPLAVQVGNFLDNNLPDLRVTNSGGQIATIPAIGANGQGTGFFQDNNPTIVTLPTTIVQAAFDTSTGNEFVVEQGGILVSASGTVLIDGGVSTISASGGIVVAGLDNGNLEVFNEESGASDVQAGAFPDDPSALEALRNGDQVEVYATYQDRDVPVFYSFLVPVLTELPPSAAVVQATGLEQSNFLLVAILLEGGLQEQLPLSVPESIPGEETFVLFLSASQVLNGRAAALGNEPEPVELTLAFQVTAGQPEPETVSIVSALGLISTQANPWQLAWNAQTLLPGELEPLPAFQLGGEEALRHYRLSRQFEQKLKLFLEALKQHLAPLQGWLEVEVPWAERQIPTGPTSQRTEAPASETPVVAEERTEADARDWLEGAPLLVPSTEPEDELFACVEQLPVQAPCPSWLPEEALLECVTWTEG